MAHGNPLVYRPGRVEDLDACIRTWRQATEGYLVPLGQPRLPDDVGPLRRLLAHTLTSDPDRFWVAADGDELVGFSSATVREGLWFLAMLFVRPDLQGQGVAAALMDRAQAGRDVDPGGPAVPGPDDALDTGIHTWGVTTDSVQPISNALYSRRGMVPRIPAWRLLGEVRRWSAVPMLPGSLEAVPFDALALDGVDGRGRLDAIVDGLDRELVGSAHPVDHEYLRRDGRTGFLVRERGNGRALGYAYGSGGGRLGPVAALDPELLPALVGVAIRETPALGTVALWVPGTAHRAMRALLDAGLRLDGFAALICWSRADHPFARYLPISLAIV